MTTAAMPERFWVKLRQWNEQLRIFVYKFVEEKATRYGPVDAGHTAEGKHDGWRFVEVWYFNPEGD